jgi:thymidine phosphorylase
VVECIDILKGEKKGNLNRLSLTLAGAMIYLGEKASSLNEGKVIAKNQITSGKAIEKLLEIIKLQGGNTKIIEQPEKYPRAKYIKNISAKESGYLAKINNYQIGMASLELGAGRKTKDDKIDPRAGIVFFNQIGDYINKGEVLAELHSNSKQKIRNSEKLIFSSLDLSNKPVRKPKLIKKYLSDDKTT